MRSNNGVFGFAIGAVLGGVLLAAMAGCDKGPTQPSQTDRQVQSQQQTGLASVTISGATRLANPGDSTQLTAVARYADGTTRDVTAQAQWTAIGPGITVAQGVVTAVAYGTAEVSASLRPNGPSARVSILVQPEGTYFLTGRVTERPATPVADASVRAASGSQTFVAKTDPGGGYVVPAAGEVTLTVEKNGFATYEKRLTMQGDQVMNVDLQRGDLGPLSGVYGLTITASASCTGLPREVMRRQYTATVREYGDGSLFVDLSGADFFAFFDAGFTGRRDGNHIRFDVGVRGAYYAVAEYVAGLGLLTYAGTASGTIEGMGTLATLDGTIALIPDVSTASVSCKASDHRLEFVRSGT